MKLIIGMMVAPRPIETAGITLESLKSAGFQNDSIWLFHEPGTYKVEWMKKILRPEVVRPLPGIHPSPEGVFGNFQNFVQTLNDLIAVNPTADAVMIVEDDALFSSNIRPLVEEEIEKKQYDVLSLYTPNVRQFFKNPSPGLQIVDRPNFFGGLALVIPMGVAVNILHHGHRHWPGGKRQPQGIQPWEREASDAWFGKAVKDLGCVIKAWNPSLVSHYCPEERPQGNSSRELGKAHTGPRQAKKFIGVDTDATEYFKSFKMP